MAPSLATCNHNGGSSQSCVIDAPEAGCEWAGRDGGVCGQCLGVRVDATICCHENANYIEYESTLWSSTLGTIVSLSR